MFKVIKKGTSTGFLNPIDSGVRFGFMETPIEFQITPDGGEPFIISFMFKFDDKKAAFFLEGSPEEEDIHYTFYNPEKSGTSGMTAPQAAKVFGNNLLGFMFWVETLNGTAAIKFSYEFYGDFLPEKKEASQ